MRIIFSRKGFDSTYGGGPSPIVNGRPISLPIPARSERSGASKTTYDSLGLGDLVENISRGNLTRRDFCHEDPMFGGERCAFGPGRRWQTHISKQRVGIGDVFLFFGLFSDQNRQNKHHRIFGYLKVEEIDNVGAEPQPRTYPGFVRPHPHTLAKWDDNNTIYVGEGTAARRASDRLRLTAPGERTSIWKVPSWLQGCGLTLHDNPARWLPGNLLRSAYPGQEFVTNIGDNKAAMRWLSETIEEIRR